MAKVIITERLEKEINKTFRRESIKIFELMFSLEENPSKGKEIGHIGSISIKEIKYENYRFYFITDGYKLKLIEKGELQDLLIRFVRMSDKKDQQKVIDEIKDVLRNIGEEGF